MNDLKQETALEKAAEFLLQTRLSAEQIAVTKHLKNGQLLVSANPANYGLLVQVSSYTHGDLAAAYVYEVKLEDMCDGPDASVIYLAPCECDRCTAHPWVLSYQKILYTYIKDDVPCYTVLACTSGALTDVLELKVDERKHKSEYGNEL
jgi:hypothetical protein